MINKKNHQPNPSVRYSALSLYYTCNSRTRLKLVQLHGRQQIMENSMCLLWSPCVRHRLHNQPLRLNLVSFWRDICLFFPCNRTPLNETSSSHFSVFSIRLPQVYIFFCFPSFTVDSSGLLEYFRTCMVTDGSLTFSVFLPQVTPSPAGCDGKPMFGPHVDLGVAEEEWILLTLVESHSLMSSVVWMKDTLGQWSANSFASVGAFLSEWKM